MPEARNVVTFHAPLGEAEGETKLDRLFKAESVLSEALLMQLKDRSVEVGPGLRNFKISSISHAVDVNGKRFWVDVGYESSIREWTVHVRSSLRLFSRLFGKTDFTEMERVCKAIDAGLRATNDITDIEWKTFNEWMRQGG